MSEEHEAAAAFVLGVLSPDERESFETHLETCDRCQRDVIDFAPLPGLLAKAAPSEGVSTIDVADEVIRRIGADAANTITSRNRWRAVAAAALAAAALLVAVVLVDGDQNSFDRGPTTELVIDATSGVTGTMTVSQRPWGSRLDIDLFDVPERERYLLWAVGSDGTWDVAASWAWSDSGTCRVSGATYFQPKTIDRLVVTSADKTDILVVSF